MHTYIHPWIRHTIATRGGSRNLPYGAASFPPQFPLLSSLSSLLFFSLPFPLEVRSSLNQLRGPGECCKLPQQGPWRSSLPKVNLVHFKAARKPLVAIILSANDQNLPLANMIKSANNKTSLDRDGVVSALGRHMQ